MQVEKLAEGLWWWTGQLASGEEVGSVYYEQGDRVYLFDPIVPPEDADVFLKALDRDMSRFDGRGEVLLTSARHRRDADLLTERYRDVRIVDTPAASTISTIPASAGEVMYVLSSHASLIVGDAIVGSERGLAFGDGRASGILRTLLDIPIERVLVSHGPPVRADGAEALYALLARG